MSEHGTRKKSNRTKEDETSLKERRSVRRTKSSDGSVMKLSQSSSGRSRRMGNSSSRSKEGSERTQRRRRRGSMDTLGSSSGHGENSGSGSRRDRLRFEMLKKKLDENTSKTKTALKEVQADKIVKMNKLKERYSEIIDGDGHVKNTLLSKKISTIQKQNDSMRKKISAIQYSTTKLKTNNPLSEGDYGFGGDQGGESNERLSSNNSQHKSEEPMSAGRKLFLEERNKKLLASIKRIQQNLAKYESNIEIVHQNCMNGLLYYLCENKRKVIFQQCINKVIGKFEAESSNPSLEGKKKKSIEKLLKLINELKRECEEEDQANNLCPDFHMAAGAFLSLDDEVKIRGKNCAAKTIQAYVRKERKIKIGRGDIMDNESFMTTEHAEFAPGGSVVYKHLNKIDMEDMVSVLSDAVSELDTSLQRSIYDSDTEDQDNLLGFSNRKNVKFMRDRRRNNGDNQMIVDRVPLGMQVISDPSTNNTDCGSKKKKNFMKGLSSKVKRLNCSFNHSKLLDNENYGRDKMDFTDVTSLSTAQTTSNLFNELS